MSLEEIVADSETVKNYDKYGTVFGIPLDTWSKIQAAASNVFVDYADNDLSVAKIKSDYFGIWYIPVALLKEKEMEDRKNDIDTLC